MLYRTLTITILTCVVFILLNMQGAAQAEEMVVGKDLYMKHCSSCHGEEGKGDGIMKKYLKIEPADLTTIAQRNGGIFPYTKIFRIIDGRETVRAHGATNMPVWGYTFQAVPGTPKEPSLKEELVAGRIATLTFYLATLQQGK